MSAGEIWALLGVLVGGAIPWLEAVVVIPAGIVAGLPAVPVILAGAGGNLLTVGVAAFAGEWLRRKWTAWRVRRREASGHGQDPEIAQRREARAQKRQDRIERIMNRGGMPLPALLGPLGVDPLTTPAGAAGPLRARHRRRGGWPCRTGPGTGTRSRCSR